MVLQLVSLLGYHIAASRDVALMRASEPFSQVKLMPGAAMQEGTHYEAAMRRAALMNTDDEDSEGEDDGSGAEGSASEPEEDLQDKIDALSDDEAKEELKEAQLRKLMEDSQVYHRDDL